MMSVIAVLVLAVFLWWLTELSKMRLGPEQAATLRGPDFTVSGLDATQYNNSGRPHYRLQAALLRHDQQNGSSTLDGIVLTQYRDDGTIVITRARKAWLPDDHRQIEMRGNVRIIHRRAGKNLNTVSTDQARVTLK